MTIPDFLEDGVLPEGVIDANLEDIEIKLSFTIPSQGSPPSSEVGGIATLLCVDTTYLSCAQNPSGKDAPR